MNFIIMCSTIRYGNISRRQNCFYSESMVVPVRGELGRLNMISNKENSMHGYSRASLIQAEWDQRGGCNLDFARN